MSHTLPLALMGHFTRPAPRQRPAPRDVAPWPAPPADLPRLAAEARARLRTERRRWASMTG